MRSDIDLSTSINGRWLARAGLVAILATFLAGCGGCSEEADSAGPADDEVVSEGETDAGTDSASTGPSNIYGLPLPPGVIDIREEGARISVRTHLPLSEVKAFFDTHLTDYEILDGGHEIRAIGLREFMPHMYARAAGSRSIVVYLPAVQPGGDDQDDQDQADSSSGPGAASAKEASRSNPPLSSRKRGDPVRDRTPDGKLLAPGARWGEPYTPPPGSPLDQKRLESNFGKPFGEWVLQ